VLSTEKHVSASKHRKRCDPCQLQGMVEKIGTLTDWLDPGAIIAHYNILQTTKSSDLRRYRAKKHT